MTADLGIIDVIVLSTLFLAAIGIGVWFGRRNTDAESFLLGGRSLPWWAILGSIVATETSTATVLSIPGAGFGPVGMKWLQLALGFVIGRAIVVQVFLPLYFKGKLSTAYQVLGKRFGSTTETAASGLFLVARNLSDGLRLFLAGIVIHELMGWSFALSVIAMGIVTIVYTVFGGMKSVVWNDCIQFVIYMFGGIAAVFIIANAIPGGWDTFRDYTAANDKLQIFDTKFKLDNGFTIWAGLIGGAVLTIGSHGTDHMMVQRYLSARSEREAGRALLLSGVVVFFQFALFLFIGVELACFYDSGITTAPGEPDEVFAHFIVNYFPKNTGLIGLMLAAILSAAMSTLSSSLNASASAVLNDFYLPRKREEPSPAAQLKLSRILTVIFGFIQIGIGIWAKTLSETVVKGALTIAGFAAGLLLGVFALGVLTKRTGQFAALSGAAVSLTVMSFVHFGSDISGVKIAWPWLPVIGTATTFLVGVLVALFFPKQTDRGHQ